MVHHCIVVFHFFLPHFHPSSWHTSYMSVIPTSCSFVIISFCSFIIVVMFSSMHTKLPVPILSLLNLCVSLVSTFLCQYIFFHKFVHATDCYIFVITCEVCACHWLLHFYCHENMWWGRKPGLNFGGWYVCRKLGLIMWFRHQNYMGACFQASCCHTQTMTNGNALCSLIIFILQHIGSTRSYNVSTFIWWKRIMIWVIIVQYIKKLYK